MDQIKSLMTPQIWKEYFRINGIELKDNFIKIDSKNSVLVEFCCSNLNVKNGNQMLSDLNIHISPFSLNIEEKNKKIYIFHGDSRLKNSKITVFNKIKYDVRVTTAGNIEFPDFSGDGASLSGLYISKIPEELIKILLESQQLNPNPIINQICWLNQLKNLSPLEQSMICSCVKQKLSYKYSNIMDWEISIEFLQRYQIFINFKQRMDASIFYNDVTLIYPEIIGEISKYRTIIYIQDNFYEFIKTKYFLCDIEIVLKNKLSEYPELQSIKIDFILWFQITSWCFKIIPIMMNKIVCKTFVYSLDEKKICEFDSQDRMIPGVDVVPNLNETKIFDGIICQMNYNDTTEYLRCCIGYLINRTNFDPNILWFTGRSSVLFFTEVSRIVPSFCQILQSLEDKIVVKTQIVVIKLNSIVSRTNEMGILNKILRSSVSSGIGYKIVILSDLPMNLKMNFETVKTSDEVIDFNMLNKEEIIGGFIRCHENYVRNGLKKGFYDPIRYESFILCNVKLSSKFDSKASQIWKHYAKITNQTQIKVSPIFLRDFMNELILDARKLGINIEIKTYRSNKSSKYNVVLC